MARYTFSADNRRKMALVPAWIIAIPIAKIMPRRSNLWVFGRKQGFGDGPGDFMRFVSANAHQIECVWLTRNKETVQQVMSAGYNAAYLFSIKGLWLSFRAGTSVVSFGLGDLNRPAATGSRIVQLWHGTPLKKLAFDAPPSQYNLSAGIMGRILSRLLTVFTAWSYRQYSVMISPNELVGRRYETAFRISRKHILVTGDPRCDRLIGVSNEEVISKLSALYAYWGLSDLTTSSEFLILYAPTWRDGKDWQPDPPEAIAQVLQNLLTETNARLIIRAHPCDCGLENTLSTDYTRICYLPASDFPNINEWLPSFDALISDYSGIAMDWALLEKPTLLFPYDLKQYESERGLYESYATFAGSSKWSSSWPELIEDLRALILNEERRTYQVSCHLLNRYQFYKDGKNCARLLAALTSDYLDS